MCVFSFFFLFPLLLWMLFFVNFPKTSFNHPRDRIKKWKNGGGSAGNDKDDGSDKKNNMMTTYIMIITIITIILTIINIC